MIEYKSLKIEENYPLKDLTTLKVGGAARFYIMVKSLSQLKDAFRFVGERRLEHWLIGAGSNMVASDRGYAGAVIGMRNRGIGEDREDEAHKILRVQAGETWDEVVVYAVKENLWGIENLSAIPGTAGAVAVQNAGAYGEEASQVIETVEVYDIEDRRIINLRKSECEFGYRQSIFNTSARGKYAIWSILLKLTKTQKRPFEKQPINVSYPALRAYFEERGIDEPDLIQIRQAVLEIRKNKLPDWRELPNAGSFFKNLILRRGEFKELEDNLRGSFGAEMAEELNKMAVQTSGLNQPRESHQGEGSELDQPMYKVPAAWLLEICGLKGKCSGYACIYEKQPLVIINKEGKARAREVMRLFQLARREVFQKTALKLEMEPNLVGFSEGEIKEYFRV